jgi:hypothetical protein
VCVFCAKFDTKQENQERKIKEREIQPIIIQRIDTLNGNARFHDFVVRALLFNTYPEV